MGNFTRDNKRSGGGFGSKFGGGKSFGGGSRFGDRDGGRPPMHPAVCDECGANCEVPFRPTGDRPIYCSSCFEKQNGGSSRPSFGGNDRGDRRERPSFSDRSREDRPMYDAVCGVCGKACQVPFRPTAGKPVSCSDCFKKPGAGGGRDTKEIMEQLMALNSKFDKLMKILAPNAPVEKTEIKKTKPEVKKEIEVIEVVKEKKAKAPAKKAVAKKAPAKKKK
ncbi:MAG: hypothetical protein UT91_C0011G0046 [Parcubacteria group bacterium GW2011_GWA2_40_23]|nr:MAG: hypothetical protein UT91_C0011G0046 [Parcubacteria group bacterium GW2011_GWA2_40_23]